VKTTSKIMPTVRPKVATCTVAGWRLFSVNHTGWLSKRGADTAAAETLAEVDGSCHAEQMSSMRIGHSPFQPITTIQPKNVWPPPTDKGLLTDPILLTMEAEMFWQKAVISARTGPDTREATTVGKRLSS